MASRNLKKINNYVIIHMIIFISNHGVFFMILLERKGEHKVEPYDVVKDAFLMNKTF